MEPIYEVSEAVLKSLLLVSLYLFVLVAHAYITILGDELLNLCGHVFDQLALPIESLPHLVVVFTSSYLCCDLLQSS